MRTILLSVAFCMVFSSTANAKFIDIYRSCGLGHWVSGPVLKGNVALTTNVTFDLGSTASSSYLTTPSMCAGPFWAAAKFIQITYPQLEEDSAKGKGETLNALLDIFNCSNKERGELIGNIRVDFSKGLNSNSFNSLEYPEKVEQYYDIVERQINTNRNICHPV